MSMSVRAANPWDLKAGIQLGVGVRARLWDAGGVFAEE